MCKNFYLKNELTKQLDKAFNKGISQVLIYDMEAILYILFDSFQIRDPYDGQINIYFNKFKKVLYAFFKQNRKSYLSYIELAVFDSCTTFRKQINQEYKANRYEPIPYKLNLNYLGKVFNKLKMIITQSPNNYESDDLIASICEYVKDRDIKVLIITTDTDLLQLVNNKVSVSLLKSKDNKIIKTFHSCEQFNYYGHLPEHITQLKALYGDFHNNITATLKIKEAADLIRKYGSISEIYNNINEIDESIKNKLISNKELIFNNLNLTTLVRDLLKS